MSKILSGEQIVLAHSKTSRELPALGVKDFQPTHSWLENKQIENALEQRKELLEEERVERQSCLMAAEWVPERHKAEVTLKNKNWEAFGHHSDSADWLFPEEVLYLMEMNCLECLFGEVPLSIQKGYSVLLHPEHGCSLHEYRVFAHLCRMGYRVARHLPDLTVTAYERQIRLDQHLEQKKTYSSTPLSETDLPRPDLPPKTIVELPEDTEIRLESSSVPLNVESSITAKDSSDDSAEERPEKQTVHTSIEVIEVLDSSDESGSDSSSSDSSDIQIIHESKPNIKNEEINNKVNDDDNDSDIEVIEVPLPRKEILVETIETSESEEENSSGSDSDKSYDGNWKRKQANKKSNRYQRPSLMNHFMYLSVQEFCAKEPKIEKTGEDSQLVRVENNEAVNVNKRSDDPECVNFLSIEPIPSTAPQPKFTVHKSRNEILDLLPSMGGQKRKLISLDAPDLRLIPKNIIPKQSYTFSTNSLRARVFRTGFRGRFRGFQGPRFGNFNSYNNNPHQSIYPNQINSMPSLTPNSTLTQMFGSDIHSMARGIMQFASSLLLNLPQNNRDNILSSFAQQPSQNFHGRPSNYSQSDFNCCRVSNVNHGAFETRHTRFSNNSSYNSFSSRMNEDPQQFRPNSFYPSHSQDNSQRSVTPYSRSNDTDYSDRSFSPIYRPNNIQRRGSYTSNRICSRNQPNRRHLQRRGMLSPVPTRAVDPAYLKPDVPLSRTPNVPEESLIASRVNDDVEIVQVIDNENLTRQRGTSARFFNRKRKKRLRRRMLNKRFRLDKKVKPEIVFLDSPLSNDSLVIEVNHENSDVSNENNTPESTSGKNFDVQQESRENSLGQETELTTVVKNELSVIDLCLKSENSYKMSIKPEKKEVELNPLVEIKTDSLSSNNTVAITGPIKSEVKSEPSVKCEENLVSKIKDETCCQSLEITPFEVKNENFTELSENNVERTVNAAVSQQGEEVLNDARTSTSSVCEGGVFVSSKNQTDINQFDSEMEVEGSLEINNDSEMTASGTSNKDIETEKNQISTTVNAAVSQQGEGVLNDARTSTSSVCEGGVSVSSDNQTDINQFDSEMEVEGSLEINNDSEMTASGTSNKDIETEKNQISTTVNAAVSQQGEGVLNDARTSTSSVCEGGVSVSSDNQTDINQFDSEMEVEGSLEINNDSEMTASGTSNKDIETEKNQISTTVNAAVSQQGEGVLNDARTSTSSVCEGGVSVSSDNQTDINQFDSEMEVEGSLEINNDSEMTASGTSNKDIETEKNQISTTVNAAVSQQGEGVLNDARTSTSSVCEGGVSVSSDNQTDINQFDSEMEVEGSLEINNDSEMTASGTSNKDIETEKNQISTTVNAAVSQQGEGVLNDARTSTSSVCEGGVSVSSDNQTDVNQFDSEMQVERSLEINNDSEMTASGTSNKDIETEKNPISISNVSSWAEVKKHNIPISSIPSESIGDKESDSDDEDEKDSDEIRPLLRPKHCKSIGTVLTALQIFSPFDPQVPEDLLKLKISFDMYLPTEFRKSQRGLPQYRIAVFEGSDPMPSAAQLYEMQTRFTDNVPVLRAVVMPDSIVFYSCASVSLTVDLNPTPHTNA